MRDLPGDEVSVTAAPTPVDSTALDLADEMARGEVRHGLLQREAAFQRPRLF